MTRDDITNSDGPLDTHVTGHESASTRDGAGSESEETPGSTTLHAIQNCIDLLDQVWPSGGQHDEKTPNEIGHFLILRELGRGGFGVVFLAEDTRLGRKVALKVPRVEVGVQADGWRRFVREAKAASRLDHPNLVPLLEAGTIGHVGYIASAFVEGPSLSAWLKQVEELPPPRLAARLVATLARAIEHVHDRGILHRDLKPANVLLQFKSGAPATRNSTDVRDELPFVPRICDFGLAKLEDLETEETQTNVTIGSPPYMAPEQVEARKQDIGPATDVYGLCAILYEVLTGRPPFRGDTKPETLRQVIADEPIAPRRSRPGLPHDLETICLKGLVKRPEKRYATAAKLADDLERFLGGLPIMARPVSSAERAWKWCRRHSLAALLSTLAVLIVVSAMVAVLWHQATLRRHNDTLKQVNSHLRQAMVSAAESEREALDQRQRADQRERLARRQLADHQVRQAQEAVKSGDFELAQRLLDTAGPELDSTGRRGFAWSYLRRLVQDRVLVLSGHDAPVVTLAVSPDGQSLVSADTRGTVRLWELATGRSQALEPRHRLQVDRLDFSPDGRMLASSASRETFLWEIPTGLFRGRLAGLDNLVYRHFFSADNAWITVLQCQPPNHKGRFTCARIAAPSESYSLRPAEAVDRERQGLNDDELQFLADMLEDESIDGLSRFTHAEFRHSFERSRPRGVAFTRGGMLAVLGRGDGTFEVALVSIGKPVALGRVHEQGVAIVLTNYDKLGIHLSPLERLQLERLVSRIAPGAAGPKRKGDGSFILRVDHRETVAFSPVGESFARWQSGKQSLSLIDSVTGKERSRYQLGPLFDVSALSYSPDGSRLVVGASDRLIRIWRWTTPSDPPQPRGHAPAEVWSMAFSPDGRSLASAGDDRMIRLWDVASGREQAVLAGHQSLVTAVAASADGSTWASGSFDKTVTLWDAVTGQPRAKLVGHTDQIRALAVSHNGRLLASGGSDRAIRLWDIATKSPRGDPLVGHIDRVHALAFQPDGRLLASGGPDQTIRLWDLDTGRYRPIETGAQIFALAFSPDGTRLASAHEVGKIQIWDVDSGQAVRSLRGHSGDVLSLAFSPDGATLASAAMDRTVRIWDPITGQEVLCLTGHQARVNAVAYSPDGHTLASADHNGRIKLWHDGETP
jgi:eukaryotic-like serine/threonine-protein kinase